MARRPTFSAEEAAQLISSSMFESDCESEIEDDPNFPFPAFGSDNSDVDGSQSDEEHSEPAPQDSPSRLSSVSTEVSTGYTQT